MEKEILGVLERIAVALESLAEKDARNMVATEKTPFPFEKSDYNRWIRSDSVSVFLGHDAVPLIVRLNGGTWEWTGQDQHGWEPWTDCVSREHAERYAMAWYFGGKNDG